MFSPWSYNVDPASVRLLTAQGWTMPTATESADTYPTGDDLVARHLLPLSRHPQIAPHVRYDARVIGIGRLGLDRTKTGGRESAPFVLRVAGARDDGELDILARAVIDASGTFRTPNPLGAHGYPAIAELTLNRRDADGDGDFRITRITRTPDGIVASNGSRDLAPVDIIVAATGFRPDLDITRELRLALDPIVESPRSLAPLIDPNIHSCGTVPPHGAQELQHPEPHLFIVGMKSYGRAPTFLLRTGYEQVRSVVCALTGDEAGARRVELTLPETGVCCTSQIA